MAKRNKTTAGASTPAVTSKEKVSDVQTPEVKALEVATTNTEYAKEVSDVKTLEVKAPEVATASTESAKEVSVKDATMVQNCFEYNNQNYTLHHQVKRLQIAGVVYSREKIITNDELMTALIVGKSSFVKKI